MRPQYDWENIFRELDKDQHRRRRTAALGVVILALAAIAVALLSGCTVTTRPDGATTYEAKPEALLYAIEAWAAAKAQPVSDK